MRRSMLFARNNESSEWLWWGLLFSNMSNIPVRLCYDGTWVQILNLCDIELECVMFGSKRSQEGEAGEKCRNTINDYGSKQY